MKTVLKTTKDFIEEYKLKFLHDKYDFSIFNYEHSRKKANVICKKHGVFSITPACLLSGRGCKKCFESRRKQNRNCSFKKINTHNDTNLSKVQIFINRANLIHYQKYDYNLVNFRIVKEKVKIICPIHGIFEQTVDSHLQKRGCPKCNHICAFRKIDWIKRGSGKKLGILYIIRCWNEQEEFFKFGITYNTILKRYGCTRDMPYNYEIVKEVKSPDLEYIWELEKRFKRFKKKQHYEPLISFGGSVTECFKY